MVDGHGTRGSRDPQEDDLGNLDGAYVISVLAAHMEGLVGVAKLNVGGASLNKRVSVVKVEASSTLAVKTWSDKNSEVVLTQVGRGVGALDAEWKDGTTLNVDRNLGDANVVQRDAGTLATDSLVGEEVVEDIVGKVDLYTCCALIGHWGDQYARSEEPLVLDSKGVSVQWVQVEHGVDQWSPIHRLLVHGGVEVIQHTVASVNGGFGGLCHRCPSVELMVYDIAGSVVAVERIESAQHGPSSAELLICVLCVAADVTTDHGNLKDGSKFKHSLDRNQVVVPCRRIISEPVSDLGAGTSECGTSNDHRAPGWPAAEESASAGGTHHSSVQVVDIVVSVSARVNDVSLDCVLAQNTVGVVDHVGWVEQVSVW